MGNITAKYQHADLSINFKAPVCLSLGSVANNILLNLKLSLERHIVWPPRQICHCDIYYCK